jgi:hypothetical protein
LWSIGRFVAKNDVAHPGKTIDEGQEGVVAVGDREIVNKVAGDSFPWTWGYRERH